MKKASLNLLLVLAFASLTACSGSSTQYVDYLQVDNTPKLDMKAAIYTSTLPSGNTLTITTDQSGTSVFGAYTIKNAAGTILSTGKVANQVTSLALTGYPGSPCPTDAISVVPSESSINVNRDGAVATITGTSCSETLPISRAINKYTPSALTPNVMNSRGVISSANQVLEVSVASGDNVNFVGTITLTNSSLSLSAFGTIVGTITSSSLSPTSGGTVVRIDDPSAYGFVFSRTTNFSGHFFDATDNIQTLVGNVRTTPAPLGGQYFINEIGVQATNNNSVTSVGPVAASAILSYAPQ